MNYKLFSFIIFLFLIFHPSRLNGQNAAKQQLLIAEAQISATFQPNESLKIALLLLKGSNTNEEKVKLNLLISKIYSILGDYTNAANYLFEANTNTESNSVFQKAKILSFSEYDLLVLQAEKCFVPPPFSKNQKGVPPCVVLTWIPKVDGWLTQYFLSELKWSLNWVR